jgi:hypothetical protein
MFSWRKKFHHLPEHSNKWDGNVIFLNLELKHFCLVNARSVSPALSTDVLCPRPNPLLKGVPIGNGWVELIHKWDIKLKRRILCVLNVPAILIRRMDNARRCCQ